MLTAPGLRQRYILCSHSVVKRHAVTKMFLMADFVWETTANKSCKYDEYVDYVLESTANKSYKYGKFGSFEHLVFLFFHFMFPSIRSSMYTKKI